jgi:hypothetical protein
LQEVGGQLLDGELDPILGEHVHGGLLALRSVLVPMVTELQLQEIFLLRHPAIRRQLRPQVGGVQNWGSRFDHSQPQGLVLLCLLNVGHFEELVLLLPSLEPNLGITEPVHFTAFPLLGSCHFCVTFGFVQCTESAERPVVGYHC